MGVWVSVDPLREFWNSYAYTGGMPNTRIDPTGLYSVPPIRGIINSCYGGGNWKGPYIYVHRNSMGDENFDDSDQNTISEEKFGEYTSEDDMRSFNAQPADYRKGFVEDLREIGYTFDDDNYMTGTPSYLTVGEDNPRVEISVVGRDDQNMNQLDQNKNQPATNSGMDLLRSPQFDSDGNIQLNPRGLLGSFGVPISGGIVGTGVVVTAGTPAVTSFAVRHRQAIAAGAKMIGNTCSPNPLLSLEAPTKGAVAAWGLINSVNNLNLGSGNSGAPLINPSVAPVDNTRVRWW